MKGITRLLWMVGLMIEASAMSQTNSPAIEWQQVLGGTGADRPWVLREDGQGGFLVCGDSGSGISETKSRPNYGGQDMWLVRLDAAGHKMWDRTYGGNEYDSCTGMATIAGQGALLLGASSSDASGNKTSPSLGTNANWDAWVVRVDQNGEILWDRSFGGSGSDWVGSVIPDLDGGWLLGMFSDSPNDGNKESAGFGGSDYWLVKIDAHGGKIWERTYGGTSWDDGYFLIRTLDGGLLFAGASSSVPSGNKTSLHYGVAGESADYWILKLDEEGNKIWETSFGGDAMDYLAGIIQTHDGNLMLMGWSYSRPSGNKTSPLYGAGTFTYDFEDIWVVKVDPQGGKLWDHSYGGSNVERPKDIIQTLDGEVLITGNSYSTNGTKTSPSFSYGDIWIFRIDADGNQQWDMSLGGDQSEFYPAFLQTKDGGYLMAGMSYSEVTGNKTVPRIGFTSDIWLVKLRPDAINLRALPLQAPGGGSEGFPLWLSGPSNTYVFDYSADLEEWVPFHTNTLATNATIIVDAGAAEAPRRYYRVRVP